MVSLHVLSEIFDLYMFLNPKNRKYVELDFFRPSEEKKEAPLEGEPDLAKEEVAASSWAQKVL